MFAFTIAAGFAVFAGITDAVVVARAAAEIRVAHTGQVDETADRTTGRAKLGFARPETPVHL